MFYNVIMDSLETSSANNEFASIVNAEGQWMDGAVSVHNNNFTIIICNRDKSLQLRLSVDLTKTINDSKVFGYKTSVVQEWIVESEGSIVERSYIDRVDDESSAGRIIVLMKLEEVTPECLDRILDTILARVSSATTPIESPVSSSLSVGIVDRLRRLFPWR